MSTRPSFFSELKRRNVLRAAVLYAGAAWALSQGIAQLGPLFHAPDWAMRGFVIACLVGFPFWIAFAWFYEFTPQGIKRESDVAEDAPGRHTAARKLDFAIIGVMAVAIVLLASGYFVRRNAPAQANAASGAPASIPTKSIAVLPFENLSTDKGNAYFADGMQDLILTKLADIGDLKVISRTSTAKYTSHPEDLKTIGEQLGVTTILEGSVQKAGNEVLINVQLIDAKTDDHIWAQSYQRTLDNIFGVEGEVAQKVADALKARLTEAQTAMLAAAPTQNQAAMDLFLRAEYQARRATLSNGIAGWKAAIPLYRQALVRDPGFALACARLSIAESKLVWGGGGGKDVKRLLQQAREDAERALKLAPKLAEAHLALGYFDYYGRGDYPTALRAFAAALALKPNDAEAFAAQGYVERRQGRFDDALASFRQAFARNPRDSELAYAVGETSMMISHYPGARDWFRRALAIDPESLDAKYDNALSILLETGDIPRALDAAQGDAPLMKVQRIFLLMFQRKYGDALRLLDSIPDTSDVFWAYRKVLTRAELLHFMGNAKEARPLLVQVRKQAMVELAARRDVRSSLLFSSLVWSDLAEADVVLGDRQEALDAAARSLAIADSSPDWLARPQAWGLASQVYAEARRPDLAVPLLAKVFATPGVGNVYSPVLLWLDPWLDPIRDDPRFKALLRQYAKYKPAVIPPAPLPSNAAGVVAHG